MKGCPEAGRSGRAERRRLRFSPRTTVPLLIPLALRGVAYKPIGASALLRRNLLIYGVGGVIAPFIGIKLIDMVVSLFF